MAWLIFFNNADGGHGSVYINYDGPLERALSYTTAFVRANFVNAQKIQSPP